MIKITNQEEFDNLSDDVSGEIHIIGYLDHFNRNFLNALVYVVGGTIQYVEGGTIQSVVGGTIQSVGGNAVIQIYSNCTIDNVSNNAIIICMDCSVEIKQLSDTVRLINTTTAKYDIDDFIKIYGKNRIKKTKIKLYKSVNPDTLCDFWSGTIKYEGTIEYPNFDFDINRQCGGGLHLSPEPYLALSYNQGKLLECEVNIKDIVIYPYDITKVRCRKVKVLREYNDK